MGSNGHYCNIRFVRFTFFIINDSNICFMGKSVIDFGDFNILVICIIIHISKQRDDCKLCIGSIDSIRND